MKKICLILLATSIWACKPGKPTEVLSESKMEDILVDYHLAQGMTENLPNHKEQKRYEYIQAVFNKHHVTESAFDSSMIYYSIKAEALSEIYKRVTERIEAQATILGASMNTIQDRYANLSNQGDTANIWTDRTYYTLKREEMSNMYRFCIAADSSFKKGDSFLWRFNASFNTEGHQQDAYVIFMVRYENDSVASKDETLRSDGLVEMRLPANDVDTLDVKSVSGYIYLQLPQKNQPKKFSTLFLEDVGLIRFHNKAAKPLQVDSIPNDSTFNSITPSDSLTDDAETLASEPARLSPTQLKEKQTHEQRVNIVKEKPIKFRKINNSAARTKTR